MTDGSTSRRKHVVIIGGGFAGLHCARALRRADVDVTLLDRTNHHLFQPLLYQVATATLNPSDVSVPIRWLLRRHRQARVVLGEVDHVDLDRRCVRYDGQDIDSVWAPVGDFFCDSFGSESMHFASIVMAKRPTNSLFCYLPMPFRDGVELSLVNTTDKPVLGYGYAPPEDYKKFLNFLRKHDCQLSFKEYR